MTLPSELVDRLRRWSAERHELSEREPNVSPTEWHNSDDEAAGICSDLVAAILAPEPNATELTFPELCPHCGGSGQA